MFFFITKLVSSRVYFHELCFGNGLEVFLLLSSNTLNWLGSASAVEDKRVIKQNARYNWMVVLCCTDKGRNGVRQ